MILSSHRIKTSKYFCELPNHCLCFHDLPLKYAYYYGQKRKEIDHLRYEEKTYQKLLTAIFKTGHQTIRLGTKNWYSDISSDDLLMEIKNTSHVRSALGQIICYEKAMRKHLRKMIVIFGDLPPKRELDIYMQVCGDLKVDLIYVQLEELIELRDYICSEDEIELQKSNEIQEEVLSRLQKFALTS